MINLPTDGGRCVVEGRCPFERDRKVLERKVDACNFEDLFLEIGHQRRENFSVKLLFKLSNLRVRIERGVGRFEPAVVNFDRVLYVATLESHLNRFFRYERAQLVAIGRDLFDLANKLTNAVGVGDVQ